MRTRLNSMHSEVNRWEVDIPKMDFSSEIGAIESFRKYVETIINNYYNYSHIYAGNYVLREYNNHVEISIEDWNENKERIIAILQGDEEHGNRNTEANQESSCDKAI